MSNPSKGGLPGTRETLEQAVELYRGDLLECHDIDIHRVGAKGKRVGPDDKGRRPDPINRPPEEVDARQA
jgi:hypothetical protein